jgi:hypothetical protein
MHPCLKKTGRPGFAGELGRAPKGAGAFGRGACLYYFDDLGDDAGADGAAAFADGEAQPSSIAIGAISSTSRDVVARHHHLGAFRQVTTPVTSVVRK